MIEIDPSKGNVQQQILKQMAPRAASGVVYAFKSATSQLSQYGGGMSEIVAELKRSAPDVYAALQAEIEKARP